MDLKEIINKELEISKKAFPKLWEIKDEKDMVMRLEFFSNALNGEAGELANTVKKIVRDVMFRDKNLDINKYLEDIKEELADIVIYTILISHLLDIDLENAIIEKIEKNKKRFLG